MHWFKGEGFEGLITGMLVESGYPVHHTGWEHRFPDLLPRAGLSNLADYLPHAVRRLPDLLIEHPDYGPVWAELKYNREYNVEY